MTSGLFPVPQSVLESDWDFGCLDWLICAGQCKTKTHQLDPFVLQFGQNLLVGHLSAHSMLQHDPLDLDHGECGDAVDVWAISTSWLG